MTFSRARPGGWLDDVDVLLSGEANTIDANSSMAVDGALGGPYQGDMSWDGAQTWTAPETHTAAEGHDGASTYTDKIVVSGIGGGARVRVGSFGDADLTVDTSSDVYIASSVATLPRTITLNDTGGTVPQEGEVITFVNHLKNGIDSWVFKRETGAVELGRLGPAGGAITTEHDDAGANVTMGFISFIFTGGAWMAYKVGGHAEFTAL